MPTKREVEAATFDFRKYTLSLEPEKRTLTVPETGESFDVTIKPLSWAKRNQIISGSLTFGADGGPGFDGDGGNMTPSTNASPGEKSYLNP